MQGRAPSRPKKFGRHRAVPPNPHNRRLRPTAFFDDKMVIDRKYISMNSQTLGLRLAGIIFGLVCLGHLWRLIRQTDVMFGSHHVPMWPSVVGLIIAGVMSIW